MRGIVTNEELFDRRAYALERAIDLAVEAAKQRGDLADVGAILEDAARIETWLTRPVAPPDDAERSTPA